MPSTYAKIWKHLGKPSSTHPQKNIFILIISSIIIFTASLVVGGLYVWETPLSSPLSEFSKFRFLRTSLLPIKEGKMVYGFVPYWNISKVRLQPAVTRVGYFSLTISPEGSLETKSSGEIDPGYNTLTNERFLELTDQLVTNNIPSDIVLTQFNNSDIEAFLRSEQAQAKLLAELDSVLLAYPFTGVNVDIEYSATVSATLRQNMTTFMTRLHNHLGETYDDVELSIDVYASAAENKNIWQIDALNPLVDYFVIMAYDFHRRSSPRAGPVAPLYGGDDFWSSDISSYLQDFLQQVSNDKLVLGIPFYGYEWQTTSRDSQAFTYPNSGATATIERVTDIFARAQELNVQQHWNEAALSPYVSYEEDGNTYVIYYENERSIGYKLDFVQQLNLRGIAIWALGYEGENQALWQLIEQKM